MNAVRWTRRALIVLGGLITAYALIGAFTDPDVRPVAQLLFLAGVLVAHDAILLPAAIGAGILVGRYLPPGTQTAVRVAGFITLTLLVVATPLALGFGRSPDVPSALPLPYGRGLAVTILLIWVATLTAVLVDHATTPGAATVIRRAARTESRPAGDRPARTRRGTGPRRRIVQ